MQDIGKIKSIRDLADQVERNPELQAELRERPVETMRKAAFVAQEVPNTLIYWMIGAFIGGALLIALVGTIFLVANGLTAPEVLVATISGALGALAGALSPQARPSRG